MILSTTPSIEGHSGEIQIIPDKTFRAFVRYIILRLNELAIIHRERR